MCQQVHVLGSGEKSAELGGFKLKKQEVESSAEHHRCSLCCFRDSLNPLVAAAENACRD
jgi:hypothetical protein